MKIGSSTIGMESARSYTSISSHMIGYSAEAADVSKAKDGKDKTFADLFQSTAEGEENGLSLKDRSYAIKSARSVGTVDEKKTIESIKLQCLNYLIYWLFGGKNRQQFQDEMNALSQDSSGSGSGQSVITMNYTESEYYGESEQTSFSTQGKVVTSDGREISFGVELSMSREFETYYESSQTAQFVTMTDPLVINLDTDMAELSDQKFEFDIDSDGVMDHISGLGGGSGYLALDKNGDGVINDGSELFGTKSGDGFRDLAQYDEDGNGWIDENDEIFSKLLIWSKDADGNDELYHLQEKGVGAICLQKVQTDFSLNSLKDNQTNGQIRSTGVFLYENGNAGTMQQLDLAI